MRIPPAQQLQAELDAYGIEYRREYLFAKEAMGRTWRADYALLFARAIIEVDGGTYSGGFGHASGKGIDRGYEKANAAALLGWRYFRFSSPQVRSGYAIRTVLALHGIDGTV